MYATLLTVLLAAGPQQPSADVAEQPTVVTEGCGGTNCSPRNFAAGCRGWTLLLGYLAACCGPIPQTCCAPRFGCCPGNDRCMYCYPAFHGSSYCQAYNYRRQFDYPWHTAAHAPRAFFTSQGHRPPTVEVVPTPYPDPESVPLAPLPPASDSP